MLTYLSLVIVMLICIYVYLCFLFDNSTNNINLCEFIWEKKKFIDVLQIFSTNKSLIQGQFVRKEYLCIIMHIFSLSYKFTKMFDILDIIAKCTYYASLFAMISIC